MVDPKDIPDELIDALLANYQKPDDLLGKNGILEQLTKRVMERALQAEMTYHLGHERQRQHPQRHKQKNLEGEERLFAHCDSSRPGRQF